MDNIIHSLYFADRSQPTSAHYHDCHQILFISNGSATIRINGNDKPLQAGNIVIISRFEEHSLSDACENYQRYVLRLSPHTKYTQNPKLYSLLCNRPEHFNNILQTEDDFDKVKQLFIRLIEEYTSEHAMKHDMIHLILNELFIFIYRHASLARYDTENSAFEIVSELQSLLSSQYKERYTLGELSSRFCVSTSTLSHSFKKITGVSIMDFLLSCRIAEAKKLLVTTDFPIGKIVEECGFSDFSNFCRIFKKSTGLTPSDYAARFKSR